MAEEKKNDKIEIKIKVAEADSDDVGKGIVRIDSSVMKTLGVSPGDIIEITGERKTVAIVDRAYPRDIDLMIIRMDGYARRNAKAGVGEEVIVSKADIKRAKTITIAPAQKDIQITMTPEIARSALLGRAVLKGDIIVFGGARKRKRTLTGNPGFDDIFKLIEDDMDLSFGLGMMNELKLLVTSTSPKDAVLIDGNTNITVSPRLTENMEEQKIPDVSYEDIGGLGPELAKIREMVEMPMKHPEIFERLGIEPPKGVLLYGPPGTGKTLLAKAVANETDAHFTSIAGPEIMSKWVGEAEKKLRDLFEEAEKNAPAIIFIDEIDAIAPKREEAVGEVERRVVAQMLSIMDGLKSRGKVVVIAATNRPNDIDPALRRPGRFDREIEIGVPNRKGRHEVLKIHTRSMPLAADVDLAKLAEVTHGFVGADLSALCKEAAMSVIREKLPKIKLKEGFPIDKKDLEEMIVGYEHFKNALRNVRPSSMREVLIERPKTGWEDVGGLELIKQQLKEAVEWPIKFPHVFARIGIRAPKGILLMGPPGCGKTLLAKAVAKESEANFISVKGPEIFSKWVGESEKGIREIFRRARQASPCIVFFDEIDSVASRRGAHDSSGSRDSVIAQILTEMDGLEDSADVVVIGATNRPDIIDSAIMRPGRFDRVVFVTPPDEDARLNVLKVHTKNMPISKKVNLEKMAHDTEGYSGADLEAIVREAGLAAMRESLEAKEVTEKHFDMAIEAVKPSLTKKDVAIYESFLKQFKTPKVEAPKPSSVDYMG